MEGKRKEENGGEGKGREWLDESDVESLTLFGYA